MDCYNTQNPRNGQQCNDDTLGVLVWNDDDGTWERSNSNSMNESGSNFNNISYGVNNILNGLFGSNGAGDDIANVILASKGQRYNGDYNQNNFIDNRGVSQWLLFGGLAVVGIIVIMMLRK